MLGTDVAHSILPSRGRDLEGPFLREGHWEINDAIVLYMLFFHPGRSGLETPAKLEMGI